MHLLRQNIMIVQYNRLFEYHHLLFFFRIKGFVQLLLTEQNIHLKECRRLNPSEKHVNGWHTHPFFTIRKGKRWQDWDQVTCDGRIQSIRMWLLNYQTRWNQVFLRCNNLAWENTLVSLRYTTGSRKKMKEVMTNIALSLYILQSQGLFKQLAMYKHSEATEFWEKAQTSPLQS